MSTHFSRSMRALNADSDVIGLIVLGSGAVLVVVWIVWFFAASVTLYETSTSFTVQRNGWLAVQFSPAALARIRPGQTASFRPTGADARTASIEALVMETPASRGRASGTVQIYVQMPADSITAALTGEVRVAVETVTPFALLMQARLTAPAPTTAPTATPAQS
jgi:hypothetical protein